MKNGATRMPRSDWRGQLDFSARSRRYSEGQKIAAASAVVERGMAVADAMAEFGIASKSPLQKWYKVGLIALELWV